MKYNIKIKDIELYEKDIKEMELILKKDESKSFVNNKAQAVINIKCFLDTLDNINIKNSDLLKKIIDLKNEYFTVNVEYTNIKYEFKKMYIFNLSQKFINGNIEFNLLLYQKYLGVDEEIIVSGN